MIKQTGSVALIKQTIAEYFKRQVNVTVNLGRNKVLKYCGELSGVYPALFTVRPNDKNFLGKTSYSYAEVKRLRFFVRRGIIPISKVGGAKWRNFLAEQNRVKLRKFRGFPLRRKVNSKITIESYENAFS